MGTFGMPGTFPTGDIVDMLNDLDPMIKKGLAEPWNRSAVNNLYFHYKTGVETDVFPNYAEIDDKWVIYEWMEEQSSIPASDIRQFFNVLGYMVEKRKVAPIYIEIKRPPADPIEQAKKKAKDAAKAATGWLTYVKWGLIILAGSVVLVQAPKIIKLVKPKKKVGT